MKKSLKKTFSESAKHLKEKKLGTLFFLISAVFCQNVFSQSDDVLHNAVTQNADVVITIKIVSAEKIHITGRFKNPASAFQKWTFLNDYADVSNLTRRIENFQLLDVYSKEITAEKTGAGEFQSAKSPVLWSYNVDLKPSETITDAAHVSWLTENHGLLMLGDLLPLEMRKNTKFVVEFSLPSDFKISHDEPHISILQSKSSIGRGDKTFDFHNKYFISSNIEERVFFVGRDRRNIRLESLKKKPVYNFNLTITGTWQFSDEEAAAMIVPIVEEYIKIFGNQPPLIPHIVLTPFPQKDVAPDRWRAETRGSTVTIISGVIAQKNAALQRLHEQLRHEIFHLWLPNAVSLSGDYAWFYEGFAIYRALKTGVELNQIRFEDYLNTISRAYDLARKDAKGQTFSLVEASQMRWAGSNNYIYARGLLVAFLCDVALLRESRGKRGVDDIFRAVYQKHRAPAQIQDGNSAITSILKSYPELISITRNYVEGSAELQWQEYLESAGLESGGQAMTQIKVRENLSGRQKDLLNDLGYNQWRKLLQKKK